MKLQKKHTNGDGGGLPENIEYLTSSCNRVTVLRALADEPGKPAEVRERIDIPRSTFRRILTELQERNWVEKNGGVYAATPLGEYVEGYFTECLGKMETLDNLTCFFEYVSFSEIDIGFESLVGSEVTVSGSYSPHAPMERYLEALEDADEVKGLSPVITDAYAETFYEAILDGDVYVENILQKEVADAILSRYRGMLEDVRETGNTETYLYEAEFPFGLSVFDGKVFLGAYDEDGILRALLETDDEEVLKWAERKYNGYKRESAELDSYLQTA